ncbi:MAG: 5-formyltetrahydrofolate cyclo-ligase [Alloprevotella sp.]|nr:5-formyltetrahydrofolate cyclo-ligase [Alloprevotella sp.]
MNAKKTLRLFIKQRLAETTPQQRAEWSAQLSARLVCHPRFAAAKTVMLYHALPDEPSLDRVLKEWHKRKVLLLPGVVGDDLHLHPYEGTDDIATGAFGIKEPTTPEWTALSNIDLIVVPARAYDAKGHRLGRGKGYYDRFLSRPELHAAYTLGLAFPFQMVDAVPTEPHDCTLNEVLSLTET